MKCPYCNSELLEHSKFCDNCGQEISSQNNCSQHSKNYWEDYQSTTTKANKDYQVLVQTENDRLKNKRNKFIATLVSVVLVLALIMCMLIIREGRIDSIISEAENLAANHDYESAYEVVNAGLATYPKSELMQKKVQEYTEAWISAIISQADSLAMGGDYEIALDMVNTHLLTFPESEELQQKVRDYTAELNKKICKTYSGTYSTGTTRGFDLEIVSCDYDGHINAVFYFYSVDDSDKVFGSYKMEGDILNNLDDGSVVASLVGTEWVKQPGSYYMIDFNISINADKTILRSEDYDLHGQATELADYSDIVKTYSGTYKPNWGVTGLEFTILSCDESVGYVKAEFSFYPISQNSAARTGKFVMIGRIAETYPDGAVRIELIGDEWIDCPGSNTVMIDFDIIINADRDKAYSDDYEISLEG